MEKPLIKSYLLDISSINDESFNNFIKGIKEYRKEKIEKLSLKQSKYLSLAVELLIKKACEDFGINYLNEEIVFNEHGKPSFKTSKLFFNTAHSGNYALCVISNVEVGCDIEKIKEYNQRIATRFYSKGENNYIELSEDKNEMLYRIWTLKESYLKCIGKGLALPLNSFELFAKDEEIVVKGKDNYSFIEFKHENYRIAFCLNVNIKEKEKYNHSTSLITFNN